MTDSTEVGRLRLGLLLQPGTTLGGRLARGEPRRTLPQNSVEVKKGPFEDCSPAHGCAKNFQAEKGMPSYGPLIDLLSPSVSCPRG